MVTHQAKVALDTKIEMPNYAVLDQELSLRRKAALSDEDEGLDFRANRPKGVFRW